MHMAPADVHGCHTKQPSQLLLPKAGGGVEKGRDVSSSSSSALDLSLPPPLPTRPLRLYSGSCLFEEGVCPPSLVWCCFLLTQKKSRFNGQKCEDMTMVGVAGNTEPKKKMKYSLLQG